jgi:iron complex outermembrane receptor protein
MTIVHRRLKRPDKDVKRMKHAITGIRLTWLRLTASAALALLLSPLSAQPQSAPANALADASLEDLMNIQVTSVSKREQSLSKVGAAAFVLNSEDIRRSGATNIPDLLRLVPGVEVAQIDSHTWAVSIRGFNSLYANKVLVLIDGRSVYSPLTSGVNWDQQDVPLEDIDRIEVIRGPGGTVWGANAVNGVINIITKNSNQTQGGLVSAEGGSHEAGRGLIQFGGGIGQFGSFRIFGSYADTMDSVLPGGLASSDSSHTWHEGARSDWTLSPRDTVTVQGDSVQTQGLNNAPLGPSINETAVDNDILGRWTRSLSGGSDLSLQVSFDHYNRGYGTQEIRNTTDIDFQHHLKIGSRQDVVWGLAFYSTNDHLGASAVESWSPSRLTANLYSVFVQDEIRLTGTLALTVGSKIEHNSYTGAEYEPSAQLVWKPTIRQQVWISAARAVRQPNRSDVGIEVNTGTVPLGGGNFASAQLLGEPQQVSEQVRDFELGYRIQINRKLSLDVATFLGLYRNLSEQVPGDPYVSAVPSPHVVIPVYFEDVGRGRSYGGEIFAAWNATKRWRIVPSYSFIHINMNFTDPTDVGSGNTDATTPRHQVQVRSLFNLTRTIDWDTTFAWNASLGNAVSESVPAYARVDMRLAKRIGESIEISVAGQNLSSGRHLEFVVENGVVPVYVSRSVYGRIAFHF